MQNSVEHNDILPWKHYTYVTTKALLCFYIATFSLGMFFTHHGSFTIPLGILMVVLYVLVIALLIRTLIQNFSVAALMLTVPIAPLIALIIILTMLPVLQWFS